MPKVRYKGRRGVLVHLGSFILVLILAQGCGDTIGVGYGGGSDRTDSTVPTSSYSPVDPDEDYGTTTLISYFLTDEVTSSYYIDTYEASMIGGAARSTFNKQPKSEIDYEDAQRGCEKAGKRLCTYAEWLNACMGPDSLAYGVQATSEDLDDLCYVNQTQLADNTDSKPRRAGFMEKCTVQGLTLHDMIGNLSEWTSNGDTPTAAGAAFYFRSENSGCEVRTVDPGEDIIDPKTESNDIGYRCCQDAP